MSTPKLIDVTPFEPLIIKVHYDGFDWNKLKPTCEKMIRDTPVAVDVEDDYGKSSVYNRRNQPHLNHAFQDFYKWLEPIYKHILINEWKLFEEFEYIVGNSWVNVHEKGGTTLEHHHGPAALVAATYLNLPKDGGFIQFKDPLEYQKTFQTRKESTTIDWKTIPAVTGDVLLFPGWMRHRTQQSASTEERWVLTTNVMNLMRGPIKNGR